jgi:hypothetical protein
MKYHTGFLGLLYSKDVGYASGRLVRELTKPLIWVHGDKAAFLPTGFQSDGASVPRVPIIYSIWGDRAHREADLHDFSYRKDAKIYILRTDVTEEYLAKCQTLEEFIRCTVSSYSPDRPEGDFLFRAAMKGQGRSYGIYQPMYIAVRTGGASSYHRMNVMDKFPLDEEC